jgi:hypothetical protein
MTKTTKIVLLVGICLCAICALFPPRCIHNRSSSEFDKRKDGQLAPYDVPHAFLFSPDFGIYHGPNGWVFPAEVDGGRLLAELVLIGSLAGAVILVPSLLQSKRNEKSREA